EYPTVAGLLGLWPLLTAANVKVERCTERARITLGEVNLKAVLDPSNWLKLTFFALVKPTADLLPIRALYTDTGNTNIGLNPLTSEEPIWYAGPDLAASALLCGHRPEIVEAFRIVPRGVQNGLKTAFIGTREIDPEKHVF